MVADNQTYMLQAKLCQKWKTLYRFDLQEQHLPDYEVSNWYVSTHPNSRFVTGLMAARPDIERRYSLLNNQLTIRDLDGRTERGILENVTEFRAVLEDLFCLQLPRTTDLDRVLQPLIASSQGDH